MRSRTIGWVALALGLIAVPRALAQEMKDCPDGRPPVGKLGIEELRCSSGRCLRGFVFEGGRLITTFTTEPRVHALEPPADEVLEEGDVLVAVDGNLSTTTEAARRLTRVEPRDRVRLRVRRGGEEKEVTLTAARSCDRRNRVFAFDFDFDFDHMVVPLGEALEGWDWEGMSRDWKEFELDTLRFGMLARVEPPYELGVELTCGFFCGWRRGDGGGAVWRGQHPPKVVHVAEGGPADRSGIRPGDVLLLLDGHSFVGEEGGRALGRLRPGRAMTLQYLRGGETLTTTTITPRAPSRQ